MVANADKCHLLASTSGELKAKIENEIMRNSLKNSHRRGKSLQKSTTETPYSS